MEKHTTSLEISKLIKEAGWKKETEFWWRKDNNLDNHILVNSGRLSDFNRFPAPLATEILEELPPRTVNDDYTITIYQGCFRDKVILTSRKLEEKGKEVWSVVDTSLPNTLAKMWLYLKKEGMINGK